MPQLYVVIKYRPCLTLLLKTCCNLLESITHCELDSVLTAASNIAFVGRYVSRFDCRVVLKGRILHHFFVRNGLTCFAVCSFVHSHNTAAT